MKNYIHYAILSGIIAASASAVQAGNATIEAALKARPDLSSFYEGLVSTGVLAELKEGQPYTVFAPTNDAFKKISSDKYPCFYNNECKGQVAEVLRHHIIPGEKHIGGMDTTDNTKTTSLFSIDNHQVVASMNNNRANSRTVDGKNILSESQLAGGILYKVDGVLATDRELSAFLAPTIVKVRAANTDLPPRVPEGTIVTKTVTTEYNTPATQEIPGNVTQTESTTIQKVAPAR